MRPYYSSCSWMSLFCQLKNTCSCCNFRDSGECRDVQSSLPVWICHSHVTFFCLGTRWKQTATSVFSVCSPLGKSIILFLHWHCAWEDRGRGFYAILASKLNFTLSYVSPSNLWSCLSVGFRFKKKKVNQNSLFCLFTLSALFISFHWGIGLVVST